MPDPIIADQNQTAPPPTFPEMTDIPSMPQTPEPVNVPPMVANSQTPKKKKGKVLLTILGIFLLLGAVGAGVILVGQKQLFQQKASTVDCGKHPDGTQWDCDLDIEICCLSGCKKIAEGGCGETPTTKQCSSDSEQDPNFPDFSCRNQYEGYTYCSPMTGTNQGLIRVCEACRQRSGDSCTENSTQNPDGTYFCSNRITNTACDNPHSTPTPTPNITPTPTPIVTPTPTPGPGAACTTVKAYDASWNPLTSAQLSALTAGDVVKFTVSGTPADQIDKARFTINGVLGSEVTTKKPGTDEYYTEYTIPASVTSFTVTAQIHHTTLNWF